MNTATATQSPSPKPANIYDVAKLAGVSIATASKAMNERRDVSYDTSQRVKAAAAKLGYVSNYLARNLAMGKPLPRTELERELIAYVKRRSEFESDARWVTNASEQEREAERTALANIEFDILARVGA